MRWLPFLLFFGWVYIEISLFVAVANLLGVFLALILLLLTSVMGFSLIRHQGLMTLRQTQQKLANGEDPTTETLKSVSLLLAGFFLLLPGFFTDLLGLLLLLPPIQRLITFKIMPFIRFQGFSSQTPKKHTENDGQIIEGEYQRKDDDP